MTALEESFEYCRQVARNQAKNFYYSFLLLPNDKRDAMCAIYAFMRRCDDLSDDGDGATHQAMDAWRRSTHEALAGRYDSGYEGWPAFHATVHRFKIPHEYFDQMIDGVTFDLEPCDIQTFDELYSYCYKVASVVGLTVVHIFGFDNPRALELAEKCGIAFQLTNIIRDVREDEERGRNYLPREDRARFSSLRELLAFEAGRAKAYYKESEPLIGMVHHGSRRSLWALIEIYRRLLAKIEKSGFHVMERRIRLSTGEKLSVLAGAFLRRF